MWFGHYEIPITYFLGLFFLLDYSSIKPNISHSLYIHCNFSLPCICLGGAFCLSALSHHSYLPKFHPVLCTGLYHILQRASSELTQHCHLYFSWHSHLLIRLSRFNELDFVSSEPVFVSCQPLVSTCIYQQVTEHQPSVGGQTLVL